MCIILHCEPKTPPMSWKQFCKEKPAFSIALDGYVVGKPQFVPYIIDGQNNRRGPFANFNHHEEVERLETRATCAQVLMDMREGLYKTFKQNGYPFAHVYVNDCDEDVCLSVFLLRRPDLVAQLEDGKHERFLKLIDIEDKLDTTAGSYPLHRFNFGTLEEMAWIFDLYRRARVDGILETHKNEGIYKDIILGTEERLELFFSGNGKTIPLDFRYRLIEKVSMPNLVDWVFIEEIGAQAYLGMFGDGHDAFIAVRKRPDGNWKYSVGCKSKFIPFYVPELLKAFDAEEQNPLEHWGGGSTIGGSPRVHGSKIQPERIKEIAIATLQSMAVAA